MDKREREVRKVKGWSYSRVVLGENEDLAASTPGSPSLSKNY